MRKHYFITLDYLRKAFEPFLVDHGILFLNYLVSQGVLSRTTVKSEEKYSFIGDDMSLEEIERELVAEESITDDIGECLVVNVPSSLLPKLKSLVIKHSNISVVRMKDAFRKLLRNAKKELLISVPFLEEDGVLLFSEEFENLGRENIKTRILTRGILEPEGRFGFERKLRALKRLVDLYGTNEEDQHRIEVRDFTQMIGGQKRIHYQGIHQKMIVVDRQSAYIGSGEIRGASFIANGDVGVINVGERAGFWADFFMMFWDEAKPVDHSYLMDQVKLRRKNMRTRD